MEDSYYKTVIEKFLSLHSKNFYTVICKLTRNVFKIRDNSTKRMRVLKIILDKDHQLYELGVIHPSSRSVSNHISLAKLGFSPEVIDHFDIKGGQIVILDYIPCALNEKALADPIIRKAIDDSIGRLHGLGIVHGDLHGGNIRYRKSFTWDSNTGYHDKTEVYFIDLDTVFTIEEYHKEQFPKLWLQNGFDMEDLNKFLIHEKYNYTVITDC